MQETNLRDTVTDYLQAFDQRDLGACLDFFAEECKINFAHGLYQGKTAVENWHNDRFKADMRVLEVEEIKVNGEEVVLDVVASSQVARRWRIPSLAGRVTILFGPGDLIREASFGLRTALPIEGW